MPSLALPRLARAGGLFLALYAALLGVGLGFGVAIVLERGITAVAVATMAATSSVPVERSIALEQEGGHVSYDMRVTMGTEQREETLEHTFHAHNLLLFTALVLATPGLALRQRGIALAAGLAAIFALDVLISMGDIWTGETSRLGLDTRSGANRWLSQVGYLLRYMHPTGGMFMAPVFIWGLTVLGPLRAPVMRALAGPAEPSEPRKRR